MSVEDLTVSKTVWSVMLTRLPAITNLWWASRSRLIANYIVDLSGTAYFLSCRGTD